MVRCPAGNDGHLSSIPDDSGELFLSQGTDRIREDRRLIEYLLDHEMPEPPFPDILERPLDDLFVPFDSFSGMEDFNRCRGKSGNIPVLEHNHPARILKDRGHVRCSKHGVVTYTDNERAPVAGSNYP